MPGEAARSAAMGRYEPEEIVTMPSKDKRKADGNYDIWGRVCPCVFHRRCRRVVVMSTVDAAASQQGRSQCVRKKMRGPMGI